MLLVCDGGATASFLNTPQEMDMMKEKVDVRRERLNVADLSLEIAVVQLLGCSHHVPQLGWAFMIFLRPEDSHQE